MNPFRKNRARGQSLVEVALLLPMFLVIVFGTVEYSNMFMTSLRASNISRAAANASFRDCAFLNSSANVPCLNSTAGLASDEASQVLSDFGMVGTVIATTYARNDLLNPAVELIGQQSAGGGEFTSRFNAETIDEALLNTHERVVVGEVFYPYTPITPLLIFLNAFNIQTEIYEVTIY